MRTSGVRVHQYNMQSKSLEKTETPSKKATVATAATIATAAAATGSVAYMTKTGKVNFLSLGSKVVNVAKSVGEKIGEFFKPFADKVRTSALNVKTKIAEKTKSAFSRFNPGKTAVKVKNSVQNIKTQLAPKIDTLKDKVSSLVGSVKNFVVTHVAKK